MLCKDTIFFLFGNFLDYENIVISITGCHFSFVNAVINSFNRGA